MKIAFVGKGGSGKTTISALMCRYLAEQSFPIIALDGDINQHLAETLGAPKEVIDDIPPLGIQQPLLKEFIRGKNKLTPHGEWMLKTTPPGEGSILLRPIEKNEVFDYFARHWDGIKLMATGPFSPDDVGIKCYHSKTGSIELLLNHTIDNRNEYIVVDMTAGADSFASGLFTRFDLTIIVVEPTLKSLGVYEQYKKYAQEYSVQLAVLGNKIENEDDEQFIKDTVKEDYLGSFTRSKYVKQTERGSIPPLTELESENGKVLETIKQKLDNSKRDWKKYFDQAVEFHLKNAKSWGNDAVGRDVTNQVDQVFLDTLAEKLSQTHK